MPACTGVNIAAVDLTGVPVAITKVDTDPRQGDDHHGHHL